MGDRWRKVSASLISLGLSDNHLRSSAAGKTQLCMQLSLSVQLPSSLGGASGAACILSTSWTLPTNRLLEMSHAHPAFSPTICGLADVHTVKTPTIPALLHVLSNLLPNLIEDLAVRPDARPVRLLIIDALTELFHSHTKVSTKTLVERSKNLAEISTLLHRLADKYNIAVIVVNEVVDVIDRPPVHALAHEVLYQEQARLFSRADSVPGENLKEAALGLVWANQVNARIMLSRTKRMRYLEQEEIPVKRRRLNDGNPQPRDSDKPTLVRRLTVIFNSVAPPASLDYIVTSSGITTLLEQHTAASIDIPTTEPAPRPLGSQSSGSRGVEGVSLLDIPVAGTREAQEAETVNDPEVTAEDGPQVDADEWEAYWRDTDLDCDIFSQVDLDSLDSVRSGSS